MTSKPVRQSSAGALILRVRFKRPEVETSRKLFEMKHAHSLDSFLLLRSALSFRPVRGLRYHHFSSIEGEALWFPLAVMQSPVSSWFSAL
jgi:hypothetical protein